MDYYKEITIPTWKEIQQYCIGIWDGKFMSPRNLDGYELLHISSLLLPTISAQTGIDVKVRLAIIFIGKPRYNMRAHVDGGSSINSMALNLPILNCETGLMTWYTGDYTLYRKEAVIGHQLAYNELIWTSPKVVAATKIIDSPTLVKIDTPHGVDNLSDAMRIMLSVRFTPEIQMEDFP